MILNQAGTAHSINGGGLTDTWWTGSESGCTGFESGSRSGITSRQGKVNNELNSTKYGKQNQGGSKQGRTDHVGVTRMWGRALKRGKWMETVLEIRW